MMFLQILLTQGVPGFCGDFYVLFMSVFIISIVSSFLVLMVFVCDILCVIQIVYVLFMAISMLPMGRVLIDVVVVHEVADSNPAVDDEVVPKAVRVEFYRRLGRLRP